MRKKSQYNGAEQYAKDYFERYCDCDMSQNLSGNDTFYISFSLKKKIIMM